MPRNALRVLVAIRSTLGLLIAPTADHTAARIATWSLSAAGGAACLIWLQSIVSPVFVAVAGLAVGGLTALAARQAHPGRVWKWTGRGAFVLLVALHACWLYVSIAFGVLLFWTTHTVVRVVAVALLAATVLTLRRQWRGPRVPFSVVLGLCTVATLVGWHREDGLVRCDDYFGVIAQRGVSVLIPSTPDLASCRAGDEMLVGRYPRRFLEPSSGNGLVFTTQPGIGRYLGAVRRARDVLLGSVCFASPVDGWIPRCVGEGKAQG
ncbi:MAG: hypothetical protein WCJ30_15560, partial [Deltaproteobacteria bacterium]